MAAKTVLMHRCKQASINDGSELICSCKLHTTERRALEMIAAGLAVWKREIPKGGVDKRHLMVCGRQPSIRATTIEMAHIERAYVDGNKYARDRIEAYGGKL